jgi:aminopeptidase N
LDAFQRRQLGFTVRGETELTDFFRSHEVSHQWWGHKVAWKSYHDQWLSEGFATFSGTLFAQKSGSTAEYVDRLQIARKRMREVDDKGHVRESVGPIWMGLRLNSTESLGAYQVLVYEKGGFALHMLRMMLFNPRDPSGDPERSFKTMMRDFTQTYDNKAASTEDFKAIAEKYMLDDMNLDGNGRLDWFFNQYVYGTGLPTYDFKYTVADAGGGQWKFTGTITQSGVPEGWKDVLPLYIEYNRNIIRVGNVNIMQRVTTWEQMLPFKPTRFILCRNEDNIGTIKQ